jgi:hypothetical protein
MLIYRPALGRDGGAESPENRFPAPQGAHRGVCDARLGRNGVRPDEGHERREVPISLFLVDELRSTPPAESPTTLSSAAFAARRCAIPASNAARSTKHASGLAFRGSPARIPPHGRVAGYRLRRRCQGRAANGRPQVGCDDARPVRALIPRSARRCRRRNGRRSGQGARRWCQKCVTMRGGQIAHASK